ncbi:MBL fold metallo-hydrolase [Fusibacter paucivorans]|uniref:MBL fold metallo-hydrolase n=1 Tax=Fusibacter paucivorans TaxID=76009 RepID=A0ABS5PRM9_9FIRM|nr:MBL fold metallo-hydrolase [Fusibacter paucivorans]MBS7527820.1 MBL fold metallo-hydrolase [Fusibacter paucivorans]
MKLTVLMDNHTHINEYYLGEPAACYYLEDGDRRILFDVGYSDAFLQNAAKMGIDLGTVDTIAFSHGHDDHTRGLQYLKDKIDLQSVKVVAHPLCFQPKQAEGNDVGAPYNTAEMAKMCELSLTKEPMKLSDHITFLGEIPRLNDFEKPKLKSQINIDGNWEDDALIDDTALVYDSADGLWIITGCSHSGICNITEYAKQIFKTERIAGIIGGFHLFEVNEQVIKTIDYFEANKVAQLYPSHCVSFKAKAKIHERHPIHEVGVGLTMQWD